MRRMTAEAVNKGGGTIRPGGMDGRRTCAGIYTGRDSILKIRQSAEDYLETILVLSQKKPMIRSIDVVNELGFSKPSVSIAMKNLRENGYISMDREGYITLKPAGREIAEMIYERHIFLSDMLVSLGVDRKTALEDACRIEHVISAEIFEAMKRHIQEQREKAGNAGREKQEGQP